MRCPSGLNAPPITAWVVTDDFEGGESFDQGVEHGTRPGSSANTGISAATTSENVAGLTRY